MHSNTFAWIHAKVSLGKQNFPARMFLRGMRFLSPCQICQAGGSVPPTPGGRGLSLGPPQQYILIVQPSWCCGWQCYFSRVCRVVYFTPTLPSLPSAATPWRSEKQLAYLLTVSGTFSYFWNMMKKKEVAESYRVGSRADTVPALAARHTFLPEMIFWHLFTDPRFKSRPNMEEAFRRSCQPEREKRKRGGGRERLMWGCKEKRSQHFWGQFKVCLLCLLFPKILSYFALLRYFLLFKALCSGNVCKKARLVTLDCLLQKITIISIQSDTKWSTQFSEKRLLKTL